MECFDGTEITMPEELERWDVDDNGTRFDYTLKREAYPMDNRFVSNTSHFGLWHILSHACSNYWLDNGQSLDGQDGRKEIREFKIEAHCYEFVYVAEVIRTGGTTLGYLLMGVYGRST